MNVGEIPQDDSILEGHRRACYAKDDDGRFVIVASRGWEVEAIANRQAQIDVESRIAAAARAVIEGRRSPLAFHMARAHMDVGLLASYTGFWSLRIRHHLRPRVFARLPERILQRYADALSIDVRAIREMPAGDPALCAPAALRPGQREC